MLQLLLIYTTTTTTTTTSTAISNTNENNNHGEDKTINYKKQNDMNEKDELNDKLPITIITLRTLMHKYYIPLLER